MFVANLMTKLTGPFFVEAKVKINADVYIELLKNCYLPAMAVRPEIMSHGIWQEDNAPSHTAKKVSAWKKELGNWPFEA